MKKIIAILMAAVMMLMLGGCAGNNKATQVSSTSDEAAKAIKAEDYKKTYKGFIKYLLDKGYIINRDGNGDWLRSAVYYEYIGANDGIRYYTPDRTGFVEIYDFSGDRSETAEATLAQIKEKGEISVVKDMDNMKADLSKSGTIVIAYSASSKHANYDKIKGELENW